MATITISVTLQTGAIGAGKSRRYCSRSAVKRGQEIADDDEQQPAEMVLR
jgi:hypothetical protein